MSSKVQVAKQEVERKTKRKRKAENKQPLREQRELERCPKCMEMWQSCLDQATLEPGRIEDLLVRNTLD
jgi:hypothetical protein